MSAGAARWEVEYAQALLAACGWEGAVDDAGAEHPAVAWARSGLMEVTGWAAGAGLMCPAPLAAAANGAMRAFRAVSGLVDGVPGGAALLGERARLRGLSRQGQTAPGGACRLLPARDGWLAVSLARLEDWASVPAWLRADVPQDWGSVTAAVRLAGADTLVAQGRILGLAVARADGACAAAPWCEVSAETRAVAPGGRAPLVVDLSTLWAGPLAGRVLGAAGALVTKVESAGRPDGARLGHGGHFDALNGGKACVALDFAQASGRAALRALLLRADIVMESARPRGLLQMGIFAEEICAARPGLVWVSITAHGRVGEAANWVGFGDDAAVAAGLARVMAAATGQMLFAGDAVGDPLTGLHAALVALAAWRQGRGGVYALSLAGVVARAMGLGGAPGPDGLTGRMEDWTRVARGWAGRPYALAAPGPAARTLGADNLAVLAGLGVPC